MVFDFLFRFLFSRRASSVIRRISWLSFFGLTISIAALILVLSIMKALNQRIEKRTLAAEPHLWVKVPDFPFDKIDTHPVYQKLKEHPEWKIAVEESQDIIFRTESGLFQGAIARGMTQDFYFDFLRGLAKIKGKNNFSDAELEVDYKLGPNEVALGVDLARALNVYVGDRLMVLPPESLLLTAGEALSYDQVIVKSILSTDIADVDYKNAFYISGLSLKKLKKSPSRQGAIVVWLNDSKLTDSVKEDLEKFDGVQVETWSHRNSALFLALKLEKSMIGLFLGLAASVAGLSLLSVMALLISQKKKEFGLLQSLGLGPEAMRKLLVGVGMGLASMGLFAGAIMGASLSLYLEFYPLKVLPDIYYDADIPAKTDWFLIAVVLLVGLVLSYFGSKAVGKKLYSLSPSELLRSQSRT